MVVEVNTRVFLIHGANGSPGENWFPWLGEKLTSLGIEVIAPQFPIGEKQTLDNWLNLFDQYLPIVDRNTVFVAHSLGPAFVLSLLEAAKTRVRACFFVAPFVGELGIREFDSINSTFTNKSFDWGAIRRNCGAFYVYSSDDDPYVRLEKGEFLTDRLGARMKVIEGAGHFNRSSSYTIFPELLSDISRELGL
ncbi:MAG: serine hydrolase family protein [Candidatus Micrarchaeota archaeon]|nr:serine hydrolase family protein [Candidatus Micrarchaeota archaeon]